MSINDYREREAKRHRENAAELAAERPTTVDIPPLAIPIRLTGISISADERFVSGYRYVYRGAISLRTTFGHVMRYCEHEHRKAVAAKECARKTAMADFPKLAELDLSFPVTPKEVEPR